MKKFLIPFMIGAAVALAVEFFQKDNLSAEAPPPSTPSESVAEPATEKTAEK